MNLWRELQRRAVTNAEYISFADIELKSGNTRAGTTIDEETAMSLTAVYRSVQINCDTISTMPIDSFAKRRGDARESYAAPFWLEAPNDEQDWQQFVAQVEMSYELDGNWFVMKAVADGGRLAALYVLDPLAVTPKRVETNGRIIKVYDVKQLNGSVKTLLPNEVIHGTGMVPAGKLRGLSPIGQLREALGVRAAAEEFGASFFGDGANLSGVIEYPAGAKELSPEAASRLKSDFTYKHGGLSKSHAVAVLGGGAAWKPMSVKPEEAQFVATMKMGDVQIACTFGVPPEWVTDAEGAKGYVTSLYARKEMWLVTGLNPRLVRLEKPFSRLLPRPAYVEFNRDSFLRMSPTDRAAFYDSMQGGERISVDEIRALENLKPYGGEYAKPLKSVQWVHEGTPPPDSETEPNEPAA